MKTFPFYMLSLFVTLCLSACVAQEPINPGVYEEYSNENTLLGEKEEIILYPDRNQTFEYRYHTNNANGEKYGTGTYRQTEKKLVLKFQQSTPPRSFSELLSTDQQQDQLNYQFRIIGSKSGEPLSGVNASVYNPENMEIATAVSDNNGSVSLNIPPGSSPAYFRVSSPVHDPIQQELPSVSSRYLVSMAINYVDIITKGTVIKFDILDVSLDHIELMRNDREKYFALKEPD